MFNSSKQPLIIYYSTKVMHEATKRQHKENQSLNLNMLFAEQFHTQHEG